MAEKTLVLPELGTVRFIKSARNRSVRISVSQSGVRVSLPSWTRYSVAYDFVLRQQAWILDQRSKHAKPMLEDGSKIGKLHTLSFQSVPHSTTLRTTITPTKLIIPLHPNEEIAHLDVQKRTELAAIRALRKEAQVLLPTRLHNIAETHQYSYKSVAVKNLKRRWGSCDAQGNIILNLYLMQLSWQQIDYVLSHELAHTRHLNHSAAFWASVEVMVPDAKMIAKKVRYIQPALLPLSTQTSVAID